MYTKKFISEQLRALGAPQNSVVLVHSSLRAVGETEGRAEGLLDALIEYFTADGGLLCIPSHTWHKLGKDEITLDMTKNECCVGTLGKIAAIAPRGQRTANPSHSMVVFGDSERVSEFISGEDEHLTHTAPKSCYGKIYDNDGYILLVGVGQDKNTFMHCVEEMMGIDNRIDTESVSVSVKYKNGEVVTRAIFSFNEKLNGDVSEYFPKYEAAFRHHGCIADGHIGSAAVQLCSARGIKRVMELVRERSGGIELLHDNTPLKEEWYK